MATMGDGDESDDVDGRATRRRCVREPRVPGERRAVDGRSDVAGTLAFCFCVAATVKSKFFKTDHLRSHGSR